MLFLFACLLSLAVGSGRVRIGNTCFDDEEWCKEPDPASDNDMWLVTWREWEPDPSQYASVCHTPGCHTVHHWGYHTRLFVSHKGALEWLNVMYAGEASNVVSIRQCSVVPLARHVVGNKTVERTVKVQEEVPREEWK